MHVTNEINLDMIFFSHNFNHEIRLFHLSTIPTSISFYISFKILLFVFLKLKLTVIQHKHLTMDDND